MSFQIVPDQLEEVEEDVNTAIAVAVSTNRNALMEIGINEEEEGTPMSQSTNIEGQLQTQQSYSSDTLFPDDVQSFLINLNDSITRRDIERIRYFHENSHNNLTFKYYMKSRWPNPSVVENLIDSFSYFSELTKLLYTEQYYRHIFAKFPNHVKWIDRVSSWKNYIALFNYLLFRGHSNTESQEVQVPNSLKEYFESNDLSTNYDREDEICLPPEMINGIIDEFLYQFQDTCRYRTRIAHVISMSEQSQNEGRAAKVDQDVWRCDIILQIFQSFVDLSEIRALMSTDGAVSQQDQLQALSSVDLIPIRYQLGYFSILGLLRLHALLGSYYIAIEISNGIDHQIFRPLLWKVQTAYVSYLYYLGFSYMMLQRYIDAIRIFQQSTVSFTSNAMNSNNSSSHSSPYQHDAIGKFVDRMSWLMLFCQLLSYGNSSNFNRMEESLSHQNDRKTSPSFSPLGSDTSNWKEMLSKVSPRFISPSVPVITPRDQMVKTDQSEPQQRQMQTFSPLMHLYELSSMIRSFTKLYNNLNVDTLASLMHIAKKNGNLKSREVIKSRGGADSQTNEPTNNIPLVSDDFEVQEPSSIARSQIIAIKSRSGRQRIWKSGDLHSGELVPLNGDVDLLLDLDTIHIIEGKQVDKFFGDIFAKQIVKARNLLRHIDSLTSKSSDLSSKREKA
ncbi:HSPC021 HSPC025 family protein [Cryptosporidium ubiquitum]|uniref:Eukaryotic translation initiation factor 3 subunit L n=1 Tax=Cryptosporidium ubiquitum TaxID=857276 RepID=A0A1J4MI38_9CRYT|nr:HSPC021 HSPC025 family protein [Cryptosporidium ubiquitum]OII72501.1 HSPC021 HSPC025 family protein [Cryptosporidium ubiquitum]